MASNFSFPGSNQTLTGRTQNPASVQNPDSQVSEMMLGRNGELVVSALHAGYGEAAHRKMVFFGAASSAGIAIPINTTTSGSTFALYNPAGSGVNAEVLRFKLDFLHTNAAPATANVVGFSMVNDTTNATSAITGLAGPTGGGGAAGGQNVQVGAGSPKCTLAGTITYASALTVAANWGVPMFSFPASWVPTVGGYPVPLIYEFKGSLVVPPGFSITLTASTAWGSNTTVPSLFWMEHAA